MTTRPTGVDAIGEVLELAEAKRDRAAGEQLDLEGLGPLPPTRHVPGTPEHARFLEDVRRGRGRPLGAKNLASARRIELMVRLFGDPFVESARWLGHTPETLARELGCTKREAFELLEGIRRDLRRYVHAPRAAEDGSGSAVPPAFNLVLGGAIAGVDGRPPWAYLDDKKDQAKQALAAPAPGVSHADVSHGEPK